ncbi:uncharacterized protein LOC135482628 [Lineus longissimus]|uniref:uncharacterized protein LOC135482628 n=1 Tax=Lineus longissimus TaxID=88925 RepID=UPI00315DC94C
MLDEEVVNTKKVNGLRIQDMNKSLDISMPAVYERDIIPASHSQVPRPETVRKIPHLKDVAEKLYPYREDWEIGVLIGMNCPKLLKPRDVVPGEDDDPYAIRTDLGWGVIGNFADNIKRDEPVHFVYRTKAKEITPAEVNQLFEGEFAKQKTGCKMSVHDQRFLAVVKAGIRQREDSHFEITLPFKEDDVTLPNNRTMVDKRLRHLRHKLTRDPKYRREYTDFMNDVITKGFAEKVPDTSETCTQDEKLIWYIPHHGVYHPKKNKFRVVFDASAEYEGHSLNQHLLQGPDLMNSLTGILTRFRKEPVAVTCDISACFYQVFVPDNQRDCLRFLWWEDGELHKEPTEYRMTRHIFGATSSPACSNFALNETANRYKGQFGEEIANFLRKDMYVDDGITSKKKPKEASHLIAGSHAMAA